MPLINNFKAHVNAIYRACEVFARKVNIYARTCAKHVRDLVASFYSTCINKLLCFSRLHVYVARYALLDVQSPIYYIYFCNLCNNVLRERRQPSEYNNQV